MEPAIPLALSAMQLPELACIRSVGSKAAVAVSGHFRQPGFGRFRTRSAPRGRNP